ncbi:hypothetical protein HanXRQr2_Chr06g0252471 [Helianthus annuus]|uniref:Uncharacterized protein n=1 Tax=Helianthus annuus TaxID=4232 RepID=A0A9K3NJG9_HELAN|nr:hypothetical protein HanXRQr2_Chr06g0252471 [Helianthus annuus]
MDNYLYIFIYFCLFHTLNTKSCIILIVIRARSVNESNVYELFLNLFGGKFIYVRLLINERTRTKICVRLIK